ncbi:MAG: hypothetical protein RIM72_18665 [Alphaproteobacteria bacterium]
MLKKMLIHGLIAAALIGGASAVYASGSGNGYAEFDAAQIMSVDDANPGSGKNGYVADRSGYTESNRFFWQEDEDDHERYGEASEHRRKHDEHDDD